MVVEALSLAVPAVKLLYMPFLEFDIPVAKGVSSHGETVKMRCQAACDVMEMEWLLIAFSALSIAR